MNKFLKLTSIALVALMLSAVGFSAYAEMKANKVSGAPVEYPGSQLSFANEISKAF